MKAKKTKKPKTTTKPKTAATATKPVETVSTERWFLMIDGKKYDWVSRTWRAGAIGRISERVGAQVCVRSVETRRLKCAREAAA